MSTIRMFSEANESQSKLGSELVSVLDEKSRYFRTSWMLSAKTNLELPDGSKVRFLPQNEADQLAELVRKRNVFARHSWENNFYLTRVKELSEKTVIEVLLPGTPQEMSSKAEHRSDLIEKLALLSSTLAMDKAQIQHRLGIRLRPREEVDFIIGAQFRYLRSRTKLDPKVKSLILDDQFRRRFEKCGFPTLYECCLCSSGMGSRVLSSLDWLFESRLETKLSASVVKTAIALESLLIFSESEALARSLSERVAFMLSTSPETRERLSKIIKSFYNVRSGIVHGSKKRTSSLNPKLVEAMDRVCVLLYLVISANSDIWRTDNALHEWCEMQKWGTPAENIKFPFAQSYLNNAIKLAESKST